MLENNKTILIVDDDPMIRFSLCQIFRSMGHAVRTAEDGFSALREIALAIPDILISDLNMPRMTGFELLSIVRRRFPSVYVIAMSGSISHGTISDLIAADGAYEKATGLAALLKTVNDGMEADPASMWAARKPVPIWVPREEQKTSSPKQTLIGCPECLRSFQPASEPFGVEGETNCTHCLTPINYALVEQFA